MILHIDESWILEAPERAGQRGPTADDYGVPVAGARHRGELLGIPVCDGPCARAAASSATSSVRRERSGPLSTFRTPPYRASATGDS